MNTSHTIEPSLSQTELLTKATRARALLGAGRLAWYETDLPTARARLEEGLALFRQIGDPAGTLDAMSSLVLALSWQGQQAVALPLLQEGTAILREIEDRESLLPVLTHFAWATIFMSVEEALEDARILNEEVVRLARAAGHKRSLGVALDCLGQCYYWSGELEKTRAVLEEGLPILREIGEVWMGAHAAWGLGKTALRQGRLDEARACATESFALQEEHKSLIGIPYTMESFAHLAVVEGQPQRAVRIFAAAARCRADQGSVPQPLVVAENESYLSILRTTLDETSLQPAWEEGRAMTTQEAVAYCLEKA